MMGALESIKKDWRVQVLVVMFILLSVWWVVSPQVTKAYTEGFGLQFGHVYFTLPLFGALCGLFSFRAESRKTFFGKAMLFFALGLVGQAFGQVSYAYWSLAYGIETPYPSIGDVGYFGSIPCYIIAVTYLARAVNIKIWLQSFENRFQAVVIPIVMLAMAYGLFLNGYVFDWSQPLKIVLDFGYPLGQAVYISLGILTYLATQTSPKGSMRMTVFLILLALFIQFFSDYTFLYEASRGIWKVGGVNDYMYLVAYFVMSFALLQLRTMKTRY